MKKRYIVVIAAIMAMCMSACSAGTEGEADAGGASRTEGTGEAGATPGEQAGAVPGEQPGAASGEQPETVPGEQAGAVSGEQSGTVPGGQAGAVSGEQPEADSEEISQGDPVLGIVDRYADGVIVIKDADDEDLVYYFSTQDAQIIEGESPIAAGELVEITYRGVMGDEEHPGTAVKVVSGSVMYQGNTGE